MKAIVLTCDKYRVLTEHMILKYDKLWSNHPFCFRIAYQDLQTEASSAASTTLSKVYSGRKQL